MNQPYDSWRKAVNAAFWKIRRHVHGYAKCLIQIEIRLRTVLVHALHHCSAPAEEFCRVDQLPACFRRAAIALSNTSIAAALLLISPRIPFAPAGGGAGQLRHLRGQQHQIFEPVLPYGRLWMKRHFTARRKLRRARP